MIYLEKEIRYFCLKEQSIDMVLADFDCKKSTAIPKAFSDSSNEIYHAGFIASYREIVSPFSKISERSNLDKVHFRSSHL